MRLRMEPRLTGRAAVVGMDSKEEKNSYPSLSHPFPFHFVAIINQPILLSPNPHIGKQKQWCGILGTFLSGRRGEGKEFSFFQGW